MLYKSIYVLIQIFEIQKVTATLFEFHLRKWDTKKRLLASIELARELIDYNPITEFNEGFQSNIEWFNKNWDAIQLNADFPVGMSSAVRKK